MLLVNELLECYFGGETCGVEIVIINEDDEYVGTENNKRINKELSFDEFREDYERRKHQLRKYLDDKVVHFEVKILKGERDLLIVIER